MKAQSITNVDIGWQRPDDWAIALLDCIPVLACAQAELNDSAIIMYSLQHSLRNAFNTVCNTSALQPRRVRISLNELGSAGQMSIDFHRGIVKLHGAATQGFCPLYGTGSGTPVVRMVSLRLSRNVGTSSVADSVPSPSLDVPRYPLLTSPGGACAAAPLCAVRRSV